METNTVEIKKRVNQILALKGQIKIIEAYNVMVETFNSRKAFTFKTFNDHCTLWSSYYDSKETFWSCGQIDFSQQKHFRDMYKICYDRPFEKSSTLEKFIKAENLIKKALKEDKENTMNILYSL